MKKAALTMVVLSLSVFLSACGTKEKTKESSETSMTTTVSTENATPISENAIFVGTLAEDASKNAEAETSFRLVLTEIKAEKDPEDILNMMKNDGVVLNVLPSQLKNDPGLESLKKGEHIRFTVRGVPAMTMSIPPQMIGNAIESIEKVEA
jgi:hypothetical protein